MSAEGRSHACKDLFLTEKDSLRKHTLRDTHTVAHELPGLVDFVARTRFSKQAPTRLYSLRVNQNLQH